MNNIYLIPGSQIYLIDTALREKKIIILRNFRKFIICEKFIVLLDYIVQTNPSDNEC